MSPRLGPCKRADFIDALRTPGFEGPFRGTRHEFMQYCDYPLHIPSHDEYSADMLREMLRGWRPYGTPCLKPGLGKGPAGTYAREACLERHLLLSLPD